MLKFFKVLYTIIFGSISLVYYSLAYLFKSIKSKFKSSPSENTTSSNSPDNYKSYEEGVKLFINDNFEDALICFDNAIKSGSYKQNVFEFRGICLQKLQYHYDAINDLNKAISFFTDDCNLFYIRHISYTAIADPIKANSDIERAIELSRLKTDKNRSYNISAINMGHSSLTKMYEIYAMSLQVILDRLNNYNEQLENASSIEEITKIKHNKKNWESLFLSSVKQRA